MVERQKLGAPPPPPSRFYAPEWHARKKTRYTQEDLQFALQVVEGGKSLSAAAFCSLFVLYIIYALTYNCVTLSSSDVHFTNLTFKTVLGNSLSPSTATKAHGSLPIALFHAFGITSRCKYSRLLIYLSMEREVGQKSRQDLDYLTDRFNDHDNRFSDRNNRFTNAASANSTSISQSI